MITFSHRITAPAHVLVRQVGDESVVLNLDSECYLGLDDVGTRMWQALTSSPTIEAAYEEVLAEYDVEPDVLRQNLSEFIEKLDEQGLIEIGVE